METAKCTTRKGKLPHYADGGLIGAIRRMVMPKGEAQKQSPPDKPTMAPMVRGSLDPKNALREREEAAGLKAGGAIRGKGGPTSDDIPIMASNGEYMIRAAAVEEIGTEVLDAINKLGDDNEPDEAMESESKDGKPAMKKGGAVRCMSGGGVVGTALEPYVNHRFYTPPPSTAVATLPPEPYRPNFTMGANQAAPVPESSVTDVRAKYNPANGSPEAKAWQASRGPAATPPVAPNAPVTPAAGPSAGSRMTEAFKQFTGVNGTGAGSKVLGAAGKLGAGALNFAGKLAMPLAVGNEALQVGQVAMDPNSTGNDIAAQAAQGFGRLGAAGAGAAAGAALGSVVPVVGTAIGGLAGGVLGYLGADKAIEAGRSALGVDPRAPATRAPSILPTATPPTAAPIPTAAAPAAPVATPTVQTVPAAIQPQQNNVVTRVGNSYSGAPGISGDIQIANGQGAIRAPRGGVSSIDTSAGYASDLRQLAEIDKQKAEQNANIQAQERYAQDNVLQQRALGGNRNAAAILQGRTQDRTTQRGQDIQAGASRESAQLARQKLGLETTAQGIENRGKEQTLAGQKQLADAQAEYLAAGDDPVKLKAAERKLITLGGKQPQNDKGQVISLPDTLGDQGQVVRGGQAVLMPDGRIVRPEQKAEASPPPTPAVQMLKQNPSLAAQFDAKYGPGASKQYLTQK